MSCTKNNNFPVKIATPKYMGCDIATFSSDSVTFSEGIFELDILEGDTLTVGIQKIADLIKELRTDVVMLKDKVDELT